MNRTSRLLKFKIPNREFSSVNFRKDVWTSKRVVKSPCEDIMIPKITLDEYIWKKLIKWPTKVAAVCGITNRKYKYEEMYKQTRTLAANLRKKCKLENGDAVAVMMRNSPEYPTVVLGILAAGGAVTTFNPVYTSHEIQRLLQISEAKLVIADTESVPIIKQALRFCKKDIPIISVNMTEDLPEGTISYKELVEDIHVDLSVLKEVKRTYEDICIMPYSSGTTGLPKCVELTNMNFVANCEQQNAELRHFAYTTDTNQDTTLAVLPLFHSYGLSVLMLHKLSVGLKIVTVPKFQPDTFLKALLQYQINLLYLAPPMILFLSASHQVTPKHLEHLKCVVCGAAPLPPADIQNFLNKAQKEIQFAQGYGMTEAAPLVSVSPLGLNKHDAVGYSLPNIELRVIDGEMNNLGPGEVGELVIKGPNIMKGYKNNSEANDEVFLEGMWYRSGDLAKIDNDGLITISDRLKELIKVNAFQVPPAELEYVLKEHPDIFDAAVIGVPDSATGERPKAFVILKEGAKTTEKQIMDFVSERVAKFKRIREVLFVDSIPKNPSGKILRKVLKEQYC